MAVLFAGGEFEAVEVAADIDGGDYEFDTATTAAFDSDYASGTLKGRVNIAMRAEFTAATEGWLHFTLYHDLLDNFAADGVLFRLVDTANNQSPFMLDGNNGAWACRRNTTGTTYSTFDTITSSASGGGGELKSDTLQTIDVHWKIHATLGVYEVFIDGLSVALFEGDTETQVGTTVDAIQFTSGISGTATTFARFGEIIIADESTIDWRLATLRPTANSATNNAWTNGEPEIDDVGVASDLTLIHAGTNDNTQGFVMSDITAGASADGLDIKAVVVSARGMVGESGVQNIQAHYRKTGGTPADYFSANIAGAGSSHLRYLQHVFDDSPDTAAAWTEAEVNAAEFGLRSKT